MVNFTPGPSQLFFTVPDHMRKAFRDGIPSLSHRSKEFEVIFSTAVNGLRELLRLPANFHVAFTGSATEIWERIIQNLVVEKSFHAVNGAFSQRFFDIAGQLGRKPVLAQAKAGLGFDTIQVPDGIELVALTHNETSTGVSLPLQLLHTIKEANPQSLVVVDAVSSLPYPDFDYSTIDSVFFSVQKGFGLPAGLGVWIFNDRCLERSEQLRSKGISIGSYHSLPSLRDHSIKNQTPETPNVLGIYLLGLVIGDFIRKGAHSIRKETEYKSAVLYQALEKHSLIKPFVQKVDHRSKTVIVASCGDRTEALHQFLKHRGLYAGEGYGEFKKHQLRFANFPAHSKEQFESLTDAIEAFE
jgi:phosphoserine aminotransferase